VAALITIARRIDIKNTGGATKQNRTVVRRDYKPEVPTPGDARE
jgi:hypothetical protein